MASSVPVVIIGCGEITQKSVLPAYRALRVPVLAAFDSTSAEEREKLTQTFGVPTFSSLEALTSAIPTSSNAIFHLVGGTLGGDVLEISKKIPGKHLIVSDLGRYGRTQHDLQCLIESTQEKGLMVATDRHVKHCECMVRGSKAKESLGKMTEICIDIQGNNTEGEEVYVKIIDWVHWIRDFTQREPVAVFFKSFNNGSTEEGDGIENSRIMCVLDFGKDLKCTINADCEVLELEKGYVQYSIQVKGTKGQFECKMEKGYSMERSSYSCKYDGKEEKFKEMESSWYQEMISGPIRNMLFVSAGLQTVLETAIQGFLGTVTIMEACRVSIRRNEVSPVKAVFRADTQEIVIVDMDIKDIRFPTSKEAHGSDAMHLDPDYSAAYVILYTNKTRLSGHGLTFTLGRGNEVCVAAIHSLKKHVMGRTLNSITENFGAFYREVTSETQMRWLGPEKGVIHLATAALLNSVWDLWAKKEGKPVWKLLVDMAPEKLVQCIDFRYLTDVLTPEQAVTMLREKMETRGERESDVLKHGIAAYTTSIGWYGYSETKIRDLCKAAMQEGWTHFKMKVGANLEEDKRRAAIIRQEIGDLNLAMDANQRWSVDESISNMKELAQFNPYWIEEPTSPDDILGHARIAQEIRPIRVATGEQCENRVIFKQLLQSNAISICQIDSCRLGSVNENLAVILMAAKFGVPVCPHAGGVGLCEYVQHLGIFDYVCVSGTREGRVVEFVDHLHEHFKYPCVVQKGSYLAPLDPGYSAEMIEETLEDYEFPHGKMWRN